MKGHSEDRAGSHNSTSGEPGLLFHNQGVRLYSQTVNDLTQGSALILGLLSTLQQKRKDQLVIDFHQHTELHVLGAQ